MIYTLSIIALHLDNSDQSSSHFERYLSRIRKHCIDLWTSKKEAAQHTAELPQSNYRSKWVTKKRPKPLPTPPINPKKTATAAAFSSFSTRSFFIASEERVYSHPLLEAPVVSSNRGFAFSPIQGKCDTRCGTTRVIVQRYQARLGWLPIWLAFLFALF